MPMYGTACFLTEKLKQLVNDSLTKANITDGFLEILKGVEHHVGVSRRRNVRVFIPKARCVAIFMKANGQTNR